MVRFQEIPKNKFAAFIMTYERPKELQQTLEKLLSQTFPPAFVLIVDNSESRITQAILEKLSLPNVGYHRMGYNAGPAGAAYFGLKELTSQNYNWIYWGDDDDPPRDQFVFEKLFRKLNELQRKKERVGIIGGKGGNINRISGRLRSLTNAELRKGNILEVDTVPGGHTMIVNSEVIKKGVLPTKDLFFGFEELDFSLKVKKSGFKIFVDSEDWLQVRIAANRAENSYRYEGSSFGNPDKLWREYYSSRNLLYTYFHNGVFPAYIFIFFKTILKSVAGFKFGFSYGVRNFQIQIKALFHFLIGRLGRQE